MNKNNFIEEAVETFSDIFSTPELDMLRKTLLTQQARFYEEEIKRIGNKMFGGYEPLNEEVEHYEYKLSEVQEQLAELEK